MPLCVDSFSCIMGAMKSFLVIVFAVLGISIACVPNKSALSSPANNNTPINQPTAQPSNSTAQSSVPCSLTMAVAPVLNGLKLGQTREEVLALFPGSKDDAEVKSNLSRPPGQLGESELIIRPGKFESKEKFPGITHITFNLLDGRISSLNIGYNGPEYANVDEFVTKFIAGTNLPPLDQWRASTGMDKDPVLQRF
jgi:hypothetical protein